MRLQISEAVDDVDAMRFQALRPDDVIPLVEARFQLHEHGDLLAGFRGLDQQIDQRRVRADPVQRHLDRDDVRILHRRLQESFDRSERLIRMVNQHVLVAKLVEKHFGIFVKTPERVRREGWVLELRTMNLRELHPVAEAETVRRPQDDLFGDLEILGEDVEHARRHRGVDLQQRDGAVTQLLQAAVDGLQQIVGFVLLNLEVGVADHAEQMRAFHLCARKELLHVRVNDVFEEDEGLSPCVRDVLRQLDESRQDVGYLDACELRPVPVPDDHRKVLAEI